MTLSTTNDWLDVPSCSCAATALRRRVRSNGVECYVLQCLRCGRELRAVKKTAPEVLSLSAPPPLFDDALAETWQEGVSAYYREDAQRRAAARQRAYEEQTEERRSWYEAYLLSPAWREKRAQVLQRAGGMCEGCRMRRATQVHHLTYAHIGEEFLFELVAICDACHTRIHATKV